MPTLYEAAILASAAGDKDQALPEGWALMSDSDESDEFSELRKCFGYRGKAFINHHKKEMVVSHRGTKLKQEGVVTSTTGPSGNLGNDSTIATKKVPFDASLAYKFSIVARNQLSEEQSDYRILQVGHSLGGLLAHYSGYHLSQEVVVFDSPGWLELFSQEELDNNQLQRHFTLLSSPNYVNQANAHGGVVYQMSTHTDAGFVEKSVATFTTHKMKHIIPEIPADSEDPIKGKPPTKFRLIQGLNATDLDIKASLVGALSTQFGSNLIKPPTEEIKTHHVISQLNSKLLITPANWVVSIINSGARWAGHSILVVEGLIPKTGVSGVASSPGVHANSYELFVGYYHLIVPAQWPDEVKKPDDGNDYGMILCQPYNFHRYKNSYNCRKSWPCERGDAIKMMDEITKNQTKKPIPYHLAGRYTKIYTNENEGHNCASWIIEMLKFAGINDAVTFIDYAKAKPERVGCVLV